MSVNRNDLFCEIERRSKKYKIADLEKKMKKRSLHNHKSVEKIIKEILQGDPLQIIKHDDNVNSLFNQLLSMDDIMTSIKENLLTGRSEQINVRKSMMTARRKLEYKPLDLTDKNTVMILINHPDIPKPDQIRRFKLTRCFGCEWRSPLESDFERERKNIYIKKSENHPEIEQHLFDHYRNEIIMTIKFSMELKRFFFKSL